MKFEISNVFIILKFFDKNCLFLEPSSNLLEKGWETDQTGHIGFVLYKMHSPNEYMIHTWIHELCTVKSVNLVQCIPHCQMIYIQNTILVLRASYTSRFTTLFNAAVFLNWRFQVEKRIFFVKIFNQRKNPQLNIQTQFG